MADQLEERMKNRKFDYCIMNPPYSGILHLKILEKIISMVNKTVNISPIGWLQDAKATLSNNTPFRKFEHSISEKIETLNVIPAAISNKMFNISWGDLGIYVIGDGGWDYYSLQPKCMNIIRKIIGKIDKSFKDIATNEGYRGPYPNKLLGLINSHYAILEWIKDDYDLFKTKRETNTNMCLFFETENERRNCFDFLTLPCMKFYAKAIRLNQRVPWQYVPYLDFSQPWTDKRFCEHFGITGYVSETDAEPGSEWDIILNVLMDK